MRNNKLIITWKPDVLSMVEHKGSTQEYVGLTARSEVESFKNIKNIKAAEKILLSKNTKNILFATYNGEEISVVPTKKERIIYKSNAIKTKSSPHYSNNYNLL